MDVLHHSRVLVLHCTFRLVVVVLICQLLQYEYRMVVDVRIRSRRSWGVTAGQFRL